MATDPPFAFPAPALIAEELASALAEIDPADPAERRRRGRAKFRAMGVVAVGGADQGSR